MSGSKLKLLAVAGVLVAISGAAWATLRPGVAAAESAIVVYKSPTCGCCNKWIEHLEENGFEVTPHDVADISQIKREMGVANDLASCHTGILGKYIVEGHVPAYVIERLMEEQPEIAGISVPGMPIGSPGMEGPNPRPYDVVAFDATGNRSIFATVTP